jgi:GT2 family glycosyltransferase
LEIAANPLVSVVIVNWNGERFLRQCLDSLKAQTFVDFEIIVVDNGSVDGSVALLETSYRDMVRLMKNGKNLGFAEGNNQGIAASRGEYVATLNTDTVADRNWLHELVRVVESAQDIGMVGSKILLIDTPGAIDSVGVNIYPDGMSRQRGRLEPDDGRYAEPEEILLPSACAALYRKAMLDEIGLFDAAFFAYCEDTDLGLRGRLAGWKAMLAPAAIVHHHYSGTAGKVSPFKAYYVERNHFWIALKTMPAGMLVMVPFYTVLRLLVLCRDMVTVTVGKRSVGSVRLQKRELFFAVLMAYLASATGVPGMLKKRAVIRSLKKVRDNEFRGWFRRFRLNVGELRIDL